MCVSLHPAHFSKTKGLACEVKKGRRIVHLLGYQNRVQNLRPVVEPQGEGDFDWHSDGVSRSGSRSRGRGRRAQLLSSLVHPVVGAGNALFLPLPAQPGTMGEDSVLDTSSAPEFMNDLERAVMPRSRGRSTRRGAKTLGGMSDGVVVFDHDIYTVVLATDAEAIPGALDRVPAEKRPEINEAIFKTYAEWYPGWTFALCCFNTAQEAAAKPLLWWYVPQHRDRLFFPAVDAHDGNVPNLDAEIDVDHTIIVGSFKMEEGSGNAVSYRDAGMSDELRKLLPARVLGKQYNERGKNRDWLFLTGDVRAASFKPARALPPGAKTRR